MGDRASVHITIGGGLPCEHLADFAARVADYDMRTDWDGESFDPAVLPNGEPLELFAIDLNRGQIPEIEAFCAEHGLTFRRWSGGCPGAFLPQIVLFDGRGPIRDYLASEDEDILFTPSWINSFKRLRDLKREMARTELTIPSFVVTGSMNEDRE